MKTKHAYYSQVQLSIALMNLEHCDLIVHSSIDNSMIIINVPFDYTFAFEMLYKTKTNYFNYKLYVICNII